MHLNAIHGTYNSELGTTSQYRQTVINHLTDCVHPVYMFVNSFLYPPLHLLFLLNRLSVVLNTFIPHSDIKNEFHEPSALSTVANIVELAL